MILHHSNKTQNILLNGGRKMKSKLGITVGLFGAGVYFGNLFGGMLISLLLLAYVLLFEENEWLKIATIKATVLLMSFAFAGMLIDMIPRTIEVFTSFVDIFEVDYDVMMIHRITSFFSTVLNYLEAVLFLVLGVKALNQGTVKIGFIDQIIQKNYKDVK